MLKARSIFMVATALFLVTAICIPAFAEQAEPVNNVIFYLDYSPSMNNEHSIWKQNKLQMALNTMQALNQQIPDQGSTVAVYRFNEFKKFMPRTPYNKLALQGVLSNIPTNYYEYDKFTRCTNLAKALKEIKPVVAENSGTTSIIMVTDGKDTAEMDPVAAAQDLYEQFGDKICLHFISLSDTAAGTSNITKLREATGPGWDCGAFATAEELGAPENMNTFIAKAFSAQ